MNNTIEVSKEGLRKIDYKLKVIDKSVYDYNSEVKNFKEEVRNNLIIKTIELIKNGCDEDQAIKEVLDKFGDSDILSQEINNTFNKIYFKGLLQFSSIGVIISAALLVLTYIYIFLFRGRLFSEYIWVTRYSYKTAIIGIFLSLVLFGIWEIANLIFVKRSKSFILKILPINIIALVDFIILMIFSRMGSYSEVIGNIVCLFIYFSLFSIPVFYYFIIRNKNIFL